MFSTTYRATSGNTSSKEYEPDELKGIEPLVVEDDRYTLKAIDDRAKLPDIMDLLANKASTALNKDQKTKQRYATKLVLSNRIKKASNQSRGKKYTREEFPVELPRDINTWNEMDEIDIQLQLLKCVNYINDKYVWHKLRLRFIYFIDELTKRFIEKMDAEDAVDKELSSEPTFRSSYIPPVSREELSSKPKKGGNNKSQNNTTHTTSAKQLEARIDNDDDDDDIEIICEISK